MYVFSLLSYLWVLHAYHTACDGTYEFSDGVCPRVKALSVSFTLVANSTEL